MKPLKRRPIQEEMKDTIETFWLGASAPIPHDPKRLQRLVLALLKRIKRKNPKEARELTGSIQGLAGVERRFPRFTPEQLAREKGKRHRLIVEANERTLDLVRSYEDEVLDHIESGKVPRSGHAGDTVILQRDMLTDYLLAHPFRIRLRRVNSDAGFRDAARQWLTEYGRQIWQGLSAIPCHCEYRESFGELLDSKAFFKPVRASSTCSGSPRLIDLLLAELHRSTPDAIRKIISHAPSSDL